MGSPRPLPTRSPGLKLLLSAKPDRRSRPERITSTGDVHAFPDGWVHLDSVDLAIEFATHVSTLEEVPGIVRRDCERIYSSILANLVKAYEELEDVRPMHVTRA